MSCSESRQPCSVHESAGFDITVLVFAGQLCVEANRALRGLEKRDVVNLQ